MLKFRRGAGTSIKLHWKTSISAESTIQCAMATNKFLGCTIIMIQFWIYLLVLRACVAVDSISANQSIKDGQTIASDGYNFEMGFFSPGSSTKKYLGIWYKRVATRTVVWVANRDNPLEDNSGVLKLTNHGNLVILNGTGGIVWTTNSSGSSNSPIAQLLDTGNLVVKDGNQNNQQIFLWQSFDYPTDTLIAGMKFGFDKRRGLNRYLTSWKSENDPAHGDVVSELDQHGYPQIILKNGSVDKFRLGPWNGLNFGGLPRAKNPSVLKLTFFVGQEEAYYSFEVNNKSVISRSLVAQSGEIKRLIWDEQKHYWIAYHTLPLDNCDKYGLCGSNAKCNINKFPLCNCLDKFVPKNPLNWEKTDWSNGCVRRVPLNCSNGDGFLTYSPVKLPDTRHSWFNQNMTLDECKKLCSKNCSCTAYANSDIRWGKSNCLLWFGDLIDITDSFEGDVQEIYIRMASSELDSKHLHDGSKKKKQRIIIISLTILITMLLLGVSYILYYHLKKIRKQKLKKAESVSGKEDLQLPLIDFKTILEATNNFAITNKLGEGGFGSVYKGMLKEGQEIAVKRLSKESSQGFDEFKNEIISIAKLQHRNLVKLLGCCIHGEEKLLIYEYMPNKGLDSFIFDQSRSTLLNWPIRFIIINGIARGLNYLHQDSRLRIIHRDLKASNILLDNDLNPKISDFGLARSFGGNETQANTNRVVGTYGYMSPEYATDGLFSIHSDVFSFGVLILEIISGKRNWRFSHPDHHHNLLGHAWKLFREGRSMELLDEAMKISTYVPEIVRSIHVGLLCVQNFSDDRPNMSSVVTMLSGSETTLPQPKEPGFFNEKTHLSNVDISSSDYASMLSGNEITISLLDGR